MICPVFDLYLSWGKYVTLFSNIFPSFVSVWEHGQRRPEDAGGGQEVPVRGAVSGLWGMNEQYVLDMMISPALPRAVQYFTSMNLLEWKLEVSASLVALIFSLMLDFCVFINNKKNSIQLFPLFISVVFDMFISQLPGLFPCAEPLQPGQAEYPWPSPEGCSSGREPREGDGASVSDRCGGPATSRRQAHAGAAQERWH